MSNSSIWSIDMTLSGATTLGQIAPWSNGNKGVFHIPQNSRTGALPFDCLVSYPGHSLEGEACLSAEMQLVYSTAPANWADFLAWHCGVSKKIDRDNKFQEQKHVIREKFYSLYYWCRNFPLDWFKRYTMVFSVQWRKDLLFNKS